MTETDAQANDYKDPVSGVPLKKMEEPSYFFKLSEWTQPLLDHYAAHPDAIAPAARRNEVVAFLEQGGPVPQYDPSVGPSFTRHARD